MTPGGIQNSSLSLGISPLQASQGVGFRIYDPRDANRDGFVSPFERQAYAQTHPQAAYAKDLTSGRVGKEAIPIRSSAKAISRTNVDPMDANGDGMVTAFERQIYSVAHPAVAARSTGYVDPMDADGDGLVSAVEKQAYLLRHPGAAALERILNPDPAAAYVGTTTLEPAPALDLYA